MDIFGELMTNAPQIANKHNVTISLILQIVRIDLPMFSDDNSAIKLLHDEKE